MAKLLLILLIGLAFESAGVVLLKKGINSVGEVKQISVGEVLRVAKAGITNASILLGVLFEAFFFATLLILMARSDISFLWPLTGLSFVFATFAAIWFLKEEVSAMRWGGVVLIVLGAALVSYSEQHKNKSATTISSQSIPASNRE